MTALLCEYGFAGGWPSIFYVQGMLGLVWFLLWYLLVFDTPDKHPRITKVEKAYIESSLKGRVTGGKPTKRDTPWGSLLTSLPVWAIIVAHLCCNWGEYTFLTNIPTYLKEVLQYDVNKNGFMSSLPYLFFWLVISLSSWLADFVMTKKYMSILATRKVFNTLGQILPAILLVGVSYAGREHSGWAMTLLILGVAFTGAQYGGGLFCSPGDIAPRYAGAVYGVSNTVATLPGFLSPLTIGYLTEDQTQEQWQLVFFISAAIYVFGAIFYMSFASATLQPWAFPPSANIEIEVPALQNEEKTQDSSNETRDKLLGSPPKHGNVPGNGDDDCLVKM